MEATWAREARLEKSQDCRSDVLGSDEKTCDDMDI